MRQQSFPRVVVLLAVLGVILLIAAVAAAVSLLSTGTTDNPRLRTEDLAPTPRAPTAYEHLERFQELADEHGDRAAGTSGYEAAARYVEEQLARAGFESSRDYFTFEHRGEQIESFSVIAETEGGDDGNVIMLGAHLDGVPGSPALNDNASGAAALLVAAAELGGQGEVNNTVRFAWWGAEEFRRTHGSRHYLRELAERDEGGIESIAAYLNFDMVASPNYVIGVYGAEGTGDEDTGYDGDSHHGRRPPVSAGSLEVMGVFTDYFDSIDQPWVATGWNIASDQLAFIDRDVAVGGLFTGSAEWKSSRQERLFGGTADQPRDPNYHTPDDDLDNINQDALTITTDAIVHAATTLAEDASPLAPSPSPAGAPSTSEEADTLGD